MSYTQKSNRELRRMTASRMKSRGEKGAAEVWKRWTSQQCIDYLLRTDEETSAHEPDATSVHPQMDIEEAKRFLKALGCDENTRFRTFDDTKTGAVKPTCYAAGEFDKLSGQNQKGAGVFVVVNGTTGDKDADVTNVRAVFVDLDGAPLEPVESCGLRPQIVVESSPGRYHAYWLVDGCPLDRFKPIQQAIAGRFNGDKSICNLSRVMRVPGFIHQKNEPFPTKLISATDRAPYSVQQVIDGLQLAGFMQHGDQTTVIREQPTGNRPGDDYNRRATWDEVLTPAGWTLQHNTPDGRGLWNKPGHAGQQSATTNYQGSELLYCFSDSAGLPVNEGLNRFAVYTLLYHGGDYAAAAQALSAKGFGGPIATPGVDSETQSEETPEPDLWPVLSDKALPGWIGDFVKLACEHSEADPAAVLVTLLCRFAAEVGSGPYVNIGDARHRARTNAVIVGASSKARKGTSAKPVDRLFAGIPTGARCTPGPLSSGEGLIFAVRDPIQEYDRKAGEYVVVDPGVIDKRLFVLDEEFAAALNSTKREGNTLSAIVRGFFDDGNAEPLTKTARIKATGAHVSIVTHIVQLELISLLSQIQMSNGFGNRFLWILARRQKLIAMPAPMPDHYVDRLRGILTDRIQAARQQQVFRMSPSATKLWMESYPGLTMDYAGVAGSVVNRAEVHAFRLALIYALCSGHSEIEVEDLDAAFAVVEYSRRSAFLIFGSVPDDKRKSKILAALKCAPGNQMTVTEISSRVFSRNIKSDTLNKMLSELESSHLVTIEKEATTGAPKRTVKMKCSNELNEINEISLFDAHDAANTLNSSNSFNSYQQENFSTTDGFDDDLPDFDVDADSAVLS